MLLAALALSLASVAAMILIFRAQAKKVAEVSDSSAGLEDWIADTLENALTETVIGIKNASAEERRPLRKTLRGEPEADIVGKIEDTVDRVELDFVRYAHETDAEVTVRIRYEDGAAATFSRRISWEDVPSSVRSELEERKVTRAFRAWTFPWSRVRVL